jgi:vancomycin resistance protein VanJ
MLDRAKKLSHRIVGMLPRRFAGAMQRFLKWGTLTYVVATPALLLLVNWRGERSLLTSILLFVPAQGWLSPLILLTPLCLLFRRKLCWLHLLAVCFVLFGHMRFHWSSWPQPKGHTLTIVSANIGQRKISSLNSFCEKEDADIIAYQDAGNRTKFIRRDNPQHFIASEEQFVVAGKLRVKNSGLVPGMMYRGKAVAAWFEIETGGKSLVIYNVHMPTPRPVFSKLRGRGFLAEIVGGKGIYSREVREGYRRYWDERFRLANALIEILRKEQRSFILVGDFNMPDHGKLFRSFNSEFTDVFAARGCGYGLTFPGITRSPLTWFGPWLRIDYIFAKKDLRPIYCKVEPRQNAQHRAVVAMFDLAKPD